MLAGVRIRQYLADAGITTAAEFKAESLRDFESQLQEAKLSPGSVAGLLRDDQKLRPLLPWPRDG